MHVGKVSSYLQGLVAVCTAGMKETLLNQCNCSVNALVPKLERMEACIMSIQDFERKLKVFY
jgi:hypothetical protein